MGRACGAAGAMGAMGLAGVRGSADRGVADADAGGWADSACPAEALDRTNVSIYIHIYARAS